jgi:hypothetical protein
MYMTPTIVERLAIPVEGKRQGKINGWFDLGKNALCTGKSQ